MILNGEFFSVKSEDYNDKTYNCVVQAVEKLEEIGDKPLMMLGKIQSGKTRSFIGVISLAFDNGYDLAVVLTKNSNALAKQTTARMKDEFREFKDEDIIEIFDIMCMPPSMSQFELDKKMIIVVKKEKNNIPKLMEFIEQYGLHENKRCLIIDDEADFCSVGYDRNKDSEAFDLRRIASQINELRLQLTCKFIQVTATPYSLYLQPETIDLGNDKEIRAIKPADTVLVPHGDGYIGGEYYFDREKHPLGEYLFHAISDKELQIIKSSDRRKFKDEEILTSDKAEGLRTSIMNFIVGGCIRIIQNGGKPSGKKNKFSFIIHTEISKASHTRQENLISILIEKLEEEVKNDSQLLEKFIEESYNDIAKSVENYGFDVPSLEEVNTYVKLAINKQWVTKVVVNSENDINALLDDDGQLRLRTPLNIFIGGQILDRGVTIENLIGFYYGRAPQKMQQDTVLQHSRMYGYRSKEDLAVTRFYTTNDIYSRMSKINDFDTKLREDFEQGNLDKGVIFISKDEKGRVIPCSPQKILISNTHVLRPGKTATPVGFQTGYKSYIKKNIEAIDNILMDNNNGQLAGTFKISKEDACKIVKEIYSTIEIESDNCIDEKAFTSLINYLSKVYVNVYVGTDRKISRLRKTSRYYSDMPYNRDNDLRKAKAMASKEPTLMLMKQVGSENLGWRGAEFYWPVLVIQEDVDTAVYTSELIK
ncbi:Z1 domain-containing protein [Clostridium disporicum]|uniref:Endonuclease, Z1 domain-containing protein n=1 Tax=Clostridium disporicum TaxID=84024 RepID=A0A173XMZ0_9CLOT|nr:Z1 domain-containing protein [Clostridium disporicum]CUN53094.1 endonuclease%2C Z1 domain-containing protein [Clostridium disporicum]